MTKLCSVCGTENREEAQFCRACGTAFATTPGVRGVTDNGANVCSECGFQNKPGLRYCANCGMSLAAVGEGAGSTSASDADAPYSSPPPISYPSFAPVAPYPPAPSDSGPLPDIPDPDAEIALLQQRRSDAASPFSSPAAPNRAPLVIGGFAALLAVAGVAAWIFMRGSNPAPPAVGTTTPPVVAVPAPGAAPATTSVMPAPMSGAAPATAGASAVEPPPATATAPTTATTTSPLGAPPAAAAPLPQVTNPGETPEEEAKRLAAEKRREKAARDKAERDAKAKAATDQQTAAAAEQEAQARRRAEEAQRARQSTATPAPPPPQPVAQARGVREICAGRGTIAEAVCQSRQCGSAEHANEPICRQLREQDERRRNMQY
jgi:hypothetical protein